MQIQSVEPIVVSVPYRHREVSSMVARDGVTDVLVKIVTDGGIVGWGESCSGADVVSVEAALRAMTPFVVGRDPWNGEAMRGELFHHGLWQFRPTTGNFAWAGIDMALWDIRGKAVGEPLYRLLGGLRRSETSYFYYLARGDDESLEEQCADGLRAGFDVFYLKVGIEPRQDLAMVRAVRRALGDGPRLRLDANGAWSPPEARRFLAAAVEHAIDFVEQPVRWHPVGLMAELRGTVGVAIAANEGLWTEADVLDRIRARAADVLCFGPYWVGSIGSFQRLSHLAHLEGMGVCKHTHGELGVAAAAAHHVLLTLPEVVDGHQQTAYLMQHDVLRQPLPIAAGPRWGVPHGPGLSVDVDETAVAEAARRYELEGQYLPWQRDMLGRAEGG